MDARRNVLVEVEHHITNQPFMASDSAELEPSDARWVASCRSFSSADTWKEKTSKGRELTPG